MERLNKSQILNHMHRCFERMVFTIFHKLKSLVFHLRFPSSDFRLLLTISFVDVRTLLSSMPRLPTRDFGLPSSDSRLESSDFGLRTSDFRRSRISKRCHPFEVRHRDVGITTPVFRLPSPTSFVTRVPFTAIHQINKYGGLRKR